MMNYYLFDNPKTGILIALILEFLLVMAWLIFKERCKKPLLLIGPALVGMFVLLDVLVQTNREALEEATRQVVQAAEEENSQVIIDLISDKFSHESAINKKQVDLLIQKLFPANKDIIADNRVTKLKVIDVSESSGKVEFSVITTMGPQSKYADIFQKSRWRFHFARDADGQYRIANIEMTFPHEFNLRKLLNMTL